MRAPARRTPLTRRWSSTVQHAVWAVTLIGVVACQSGGSTFSAAPTTAAATSARAAAPVVTAPRPTATPRPVPPGAVNPGRLSDEQLVGQLFIAYVYGAGADTADPAQRAANRALYGVDTPAEVVRSWHLGGVILLDHNTLDPARPELSTGNVGSAPQITELTAGLQRVAVADTGRPLLIGTDQEGGQVQRIADGVADRPVPAVPGRLGPDGAALQLSEPRTAVAPARGEPGLRAGGRCDPDRRRRDR